MVKHEHYATKLGIPHGHKARNGMIMQMIPSHLGSNEKLNAAVETYFIKHWLMIKL
jgi:hypothetical protein